MQEVPNYVKEGYEEIMKPGILCSKAIPVGTAVLTMAMINIASFSQSTKAANPGLVPYLMDRDAEIALARSAAPPSISDDAEVLVLGLHGYETAAKGKNDFVCVVERSWMLVFDDPEFWNPRVRLPLCLNAPAARTHLPLTFKWVELVSAGQSKSQIFDAVRTAFGKHELPLPEPGSMCYMMSRQQYFGSKYGNADPHLMFWFAEKDKLSWGAGLPGSPVYVNQDSPDPVTTFIISVSTWSDGTAVPAVAMQMNGR
jgi:hypothetical protein